jgi:hypothetical protein
MNLGGGRSGFTPHVPKLKEGQVEPYNIRPASESDLPFIAETYDLSKRRYLVSCWRDESLWRLELNGKTARNVNRYDLRVIETPEGVPVGFLAVPAWTWGPMMVTVTYEIQPGYSWGAVTPSVVRYLYATGKALAAQEGKAEEFSGFGLWLGSDHPAYQVMVDSLPRVRKPYTWYLRVPDLPAFLQRIRPVLEDRLAASPYAGHTGKLEITFYRDGLRINFDKGRLAQIERWRPTPVGHAGQIAFPGLTFLQALFGYRTLEELRYAFPDCWSETDEATGLINALFPKQPSDVWPVA